MPVVEAAEECSQRLHEQPKFASLEEEEEAAEEHYQRLLL